MTRLSHQQYKEKIMRAVITVVGHDMEGIIARVSAILFDRHVNILDISQSVLSDMFAMVMLADISKLSTEFTVLSDELGELGKSLGLQIHTMHEDIFNSMHRI